MAPADRRTLLVNFFYCAPVGHAIEALRYCLGYHCADPVLDISMALNADTATELAGLCPFVNSVYAISHPLVDAAADPVPAVAHVPLEWDWVISDGRSRQPGQRDAFPGMARYYDVCDRYFQVRLGTGCAGAPPPAYLPHQQLSLVLPAESRRRAEDRTNDARLVLTVMPAGSGPRWLYPSVSSWRRILHALALQHPDAVICLVGKLRKDERTSTSISAGDLDSLKSSVPGVVDSFDLPVFDQLALVERSRVFISPHTGFGMAALAVGTPWLTISGGRWHEFFFNGVPFYSVLPDTARYPAYTGMEGEPPIVEQDVDGEGRRALSMSADRITADLPELVDAASMLVRRELTYEQAMEGHFLASSTDTRPLDRMVDRRRPSPVRLSEAHTCEGPSLSLSRLQQRSQCPVGALHVTGRGIENSGSRSRHYNPLELCGDPAHRGRVMAHGQPRMHDALRQQTFTTAIEPAKGILRRSREDELMEDGMCVLGHPLQHLDEPNAGDQLGNDDIVPLRR